MLIDDVEAAQFIAQDRRRVWLRIRRNSLLWLMYVVAISIGVNLVVLIIAWDRRDQWAYMLWLSVEFGLLAGTVIFLIVSSLQRSIERSKRERSKPNLGR